VIAAGCRSYAWRERPRGFVLTNDADGKYHFPWSPQRPGARHQQTHQRGQAALSGIESVKKNAPHAEKDNQTGE
jgi:uncharacterized protein YegP (UPF0339 family)